MARPRTTQGRALPLDMVWQRGRWPEHTAAHAGKLESAGRICQVSSGMQRGIPPGLAHMPCQWVYKNKAENESNPFCSPRCRRKVYWMTGIADLARARFYCYKHGLQIWKRAERYKDKSTRAYERKRAASEGLQPPAALGSRSEQEAHQ